ncbi:hypothetical protein [Parabacteroides distasonis]|uniref:hypothetical protein n=1 Tax=Parabacteroides distasonis TaxID=823 RepID=UPI0021C776D6|nr:hypothetical protein [Parabacteroides distasonis]
MIKHSPDCTGQSKDLLIRIADQVGFITMINEKRTICFDPTDTTVGKNVAQIPPTVIPECNSTEFPSFMAGIVSKVKKAIQSDRGTKDRHGSVGSSEYSAGSRGDGRRGEPYDRDKTISKQGIRETFKEKMIKVLGEKGFVFNKETGKFVKDEKVA